MITCQFTFCNIVPPSPPDILQGMSEREFLVKCYNKYNSKTVDLLENGIYKEENGWEFKFDTLNKYLVKIYDRWYEYYAPNETLLINAINSPIQRIVLLDEGKNYDE